MYLYCIYNLCLGTSTMMENDVNQNRLKAMRNHRAFMRSLRVHKSGSIKAHFEQVLQSLKERSSTKMTTVTGEFSKFFASIESNTFDLDTHYATAETHSEGERFYLTIGITTLTDHLLNEAKLEIESKRCLTWLL